MRLVLLGAPGAGKGTQATQICKNYNIVHISTGDIFREEIAARSEMGKVAENYLKSGKLVPDELVTKVVLDKLSRSECSNGYLLDGFPRTTNQAEALDGFLESSRKRLNAVLYLELSEKTAIERLSNRRRCEGCKKAYNLISNPPKSEDVCDDCGGKLIQREDDKPDTIKKRLMVYESLTQPLIAYYRSLGILKSINGNQPIDKITTELTAILNELRD